MSNDLFIEPRKEKENLKKRFEKLKQKYNKLKPGTAKIKAYNTLAYMYENYKNIYFDESIAMPEKYLPLLSDEALLNDVKNGLIKETTNGDNYEYKLEKINDGRKKYWELGIVLGEDIINYYEYYNKRAALKDIERLQDYGIDIEEI